MKRPTKPQTLTGRLTQVAPPPCATAAVIPSGQDPEGKSVAFFPPPEDQDTSKPVLGHLGGSRSDHWNQSLCNQVIKSAWFRENIPNAERQDTYLAVLSFLSSLKPADTVEAMIAAQLYASHAASMECYRRAMIPEQSAEGRQMQLTLAAKLTKANAAQVEALKKYRSKSEQKVVVEHVHVYPGGQAIVGQVTPGGSGIMEGQPHAAGFAECTPVRRKDAKRKTLPVAGNA